MACVATYGCYAGVADEADAGKERLFRLSCPLQ